VQQDLGATRVRVIRFVRAGMVVKPASRESKERIFVQIGNGYSIQHWVPEQALNREIGVFRPFGNSGVTMQRYSGIQLTTP